MSNPSEQSEQVYNSQFLVGLGLLSFEFARAENAMQDLVGTLMTNHEEIAFIATKNLNADLLSKKLPNLVDIRLPSGTLRDAILAWNKSFSKLRERRNNLTHSDRAAYAAVFANQSLKDGVLVNDLRNISATEIYDFAHAAWRHSQECHQLNVDLKFLLTEAYLTKLHVTDDGTQVIVATDALRIPGAQIGGRPSEPMLWPGLELRQKYDPTIENS